MPTNKQITAAQEFKGTAGQKHKGKYVAYYRVSTNKQSLGLAAQETSVKSFLNGGTWQIIDTFMEKESGRKSLKDRPQLAAAIQKCKDEDATLLVARLDRLSRDVGFLANFQRSDFKFVICDMPNLCSDNPASVMLFNIQASINQYESDKIRKNTKAALHEIKKGIKKNKKHISKTSNKVITALGSGNPKIGARAAGVVRKQKADDFVTLNQKRIFAIMNATSNKSLRGFANALTLAKVKTPRGNEKWSASQVSNFIKRSKS